MLQELQLMDDEQRKSLAMQYLFSLDHGGKTPDGASNLELFDASAQAYFPKWGIARGIEQIARMLAEIGSPILSITHHHKDVNWILTGTDLLVAEGTSHGEHVDGSWQAGSPEWGAGRWCDVFEIRNGKIHRLFIYLDPDYANKDTARYPWIARNEQQGGQE